MKITEDALNGYRIVSSTGRYFIQKSVLKGWEFIDEPAGTGLRARRLVQYSFLWMARRRMLREVYNDGIK